MARDQARSGLCRSPRHRLLDDRYEPGRQQRNRRGVSHNLEHLQRHEVPLALREFIRVLKPHGLLLLTLPDLQQVARLVVEDELEDQAYFSPSGPITPLDMIFGHTASLARGNPYMAHRTGFTARTLQKVLIEAGFVEISLRAGTSFDLWATAYKPGR